MRRACLGLVVCGMAFSAGCGGDDDDEPVDAAVGDDASLDGGADAAPDAGFTCGPITRERIASNLDFPLYGTAPPGDDRLFLIEQLSGTVRVLDASGELAAEPFLQVSDDLSIKGFEAGLLSLAFHPDYPTDGSVFVSYTTVGLMLRVARFEVSPDDPDHVIPDSESTVIEISAPVAHDIAGNLAFGPDGYLYIAMGDTNEEQLAQELDALSSKILRIDIDAEDEPYRVRRTIRSSTSQGPVRRSGCSASASPSGSRSIAETDDLYIAEVGLDRWEEVNILPANEGAGTNFGWVVMEGPDCQTPLKGCETEGLDAPDVPLRTRRGHRRHRRRCLPGHRAHGLLARALLLR